MKVTRISRLTGIKRTVEINCTREEMSAFESGVLVQRAFPKLNPDDREYMLTGITGLEWRLTFDDYFNTDEIIAFINWFDSESGNVVEDTEGNYTEQTTQWKKKFTLDELIEFYKKRI